MTGDCGYTGGTMKKETYLRRYTHLASLIYLLREQKGKGERKRCQKEKVSRKR